MSTEGGTMAKNSLWYVLGAVLLCSVVPAIPAAAFLSFSARALEPGKFLEQPDIVVEEGTGQITVRAQLSAPDPCQKIGGAIEQAGSELTLRVSIRPDGANGCITVIET